MPFFCFLSGCVLFLLHNIWPSFCPDVAQVLMPAALRVRRMAWNVAPGVYGMRQYGWNSSLSDRFSSRKGRMSKRLSGMVVSLCVCLFLLFLCVFFSDGFPMVGGL